MKLRQILDYCRKKKGTTEDFPFDESTLCVRVSGKIYMLVDITSDPLRLNLKCDPEKSIRLRDEYFSIQPGYHMDKKHWNTINYDASISPEFLEELIDESYDLVKSKLKKSERLALEIN